MSGDEGHQGDGILAQLLIEQGKMAKDLGGVATDVAVIKERTSAIKDHEARIRKLERWAYALPISLLLAIASAAIGAYGWLHH